MSIRFHSEGQPTLFGAGKARPNNNGPQAWVLELPTYRSREEAVRVGNGTQIMETVEEEPMAQIVGIEQRKGILPVRVGTITQDLTALITGT
jgi:hypothetical protein